MHTILPKQYTNHTEMNTHRNVYSSLRITHIYKPQRYINRERVCVCHVCMNTSYTRIHMETMSSERERESVRKTRQSE